MAHALSLNFSGGGTGEFDPVSLRNLALLRVRAANLIVSYGDTTDGVVSLLCDAESLLCGMEAAAAGERVTPPKGAGRLATLAEQAEVARNFLYAYCEQELDANDIDVRVLLDLIYGIENELRRMASEEK